MTNKKYFRIDLFNKDGSYKATLNPNNYLRSFSFSNRINSGLGQLSMSISEDIYIDLFDGFVFCKVYIIRGTQETLIYSGNLTINSRIIEPSGSYINFVVLGQGNLLSAGDLYLSEGVFNNINPGILINSIIDDFNIMNIDSINWIYPYDIRTNIGLTSVEFSTETWESAINKLVERSENRWFWRLNPDGGFVFKKSSDTPDHLFTLGYDIKRIEIKTTQETIVNTIRSSNNISNIIHENTDSVNTYWRRTQTSDNTEEAEKIVLENKDPKSAPIVIIDSNLYDVESIMVGDTCSILGLKSDQSLVPENMQIVSKKYDIKQTTLELQGQLDSFADEIKS